jgi:transketolase
MDADTQNFLNHKALEMGKLTVRMTTLAGSGHPSSALSLAHLVATLMYNQMRYDPKDPWNPASDRLVLSEGHAVPVIYAAYADLGGVIGTCRSEAKELTPEYCDTLRQLDSELDGHPNPRVGFPFFDAATGSLGQGLSVAAGLALAARLDGLDRRIYAVIGDGEAREGQIWEAVDFIADYKLTNVTPIFNCNGLGQADYVSAQQSPENIARKLEAYNVAAVVVDGHDVAAIYEALNTTDSSGRPVAVVLKTQKGWGVTALQGEGHHGKPLGAEELEPALAELEKLSQALPPLGDVEVRPHPPSGTSPRASAAKTAEMPPCDFEQMLAGDKMLDTLKSKGALATRRAYGVALRELGKVNPDVVVLDGDVSNSTFADIFGKAFPERFFECRIAEQNMLSVAGGLAAAGKMPFVNSFAKFISRAYDQIEMLTIGGLNIKICGSHSGISLGADGPSQMGLVDVAFFRSFTSAALAGQAEQESDRACVVFIPADAVASYYCVKLAAEYNGMVYIRTVRPDVPLIYPRSQKFEIGGAHSIVEGDDITLISNGYTLHHLAEVIETLKGEGISAGLVDAYSFPLRSRLLEDLTSDPRRILVTVEDNYTGGLGSAVAELAASKQGACVHSMVPSRIPKSGRTADDIFDYCGLGKEAIVAKVKEILGK